MAFNFGSLSSTPAPAPSSGFSFGGGGGGSSSNSGGGFGFGSQFGNSNNNASTTSGLSTGGGGGGAVNFGAGAGGGTNTPSGGLFSFNSSNPQSSNTAVAAPSTSGAGGGFNFGSTSTTPSNLFGSPPSTLQQQQQQQQPSSFSFNSGGFNTAAGGSGTTSNFFNSQQPQQQQQQQTIITGYTPYNALPNEIKHGIDTIYTMIASHQHTMHNISQMYPALLVQQPRRDGGSINDSRRGSLVNGIAPAQDFIVNGSGGNDSVVTPLSYQISNMYASLRALSTRIDSCYQSALNLQSLGKRDTDNVRIHGVWPIESLAARNDVKLAPFNHRGASNKSGDGALDTEGKERKLRQLSNMEAATVDRLEQIPSSFLWNTLHTLEGRLSSVSSEVDGLRRQLDIVAASASAAVGGLAGTAPSSLQPSFGADAAAGGITANARSTFSNAASLSMTVDDRAPQDVLADIIRAQHDAFMRVAATVARVHEDLDNLRKHFLRSFASADLRDPFRRADALEMLEKQRVQAQIRAGVAAAAAAGVGGVQPQRGATTPTLEGAQSTNPSTSSFGYPSAGGAFQSSTGGSLFGSTGSSSLPSSSARGFFGQASGTPTPAPGGGSSSSTSLFGRPTSAPSFNASDGGGVFVTPAPITGGVFGASTPAPASTGGFGFGASSSSNYNSRSKTKLKSGRNRR